jgi:hypothetical protein
VCKLSHMGNENLNYRIWSESMTGKKTQTGGRNSQNKEESGTNLRKARLSAFYWKSLAKTNLGQSNPNQTYNLRCADTRPGAQPTETE